MAIEDQGIRAYIPLPDMDHRTAFFSADQFRYEAEREVYVCPAGKELRFDPPHSTERSRRYRARAAEAMCVLFLAASWWLTRTSLEYISIPLIIGSDYSLRKREDILSY